MNFLHFLVWLELWGWAGEVWDNAGSSQSLHTKKVSTRLLLQNTSQSHNRNRYFIPECWWVQFPRVGQVCSPHWPGLRWGWMELRLKSSHWLPILLLASCGLHDRHDIQHSAPTSEKCIDQLLQKWTWPFYSKSSLHYNCCLYLNSM